MLPRRLSRRFGLVVTLRVGESSLLQGSDNSRWFRGSLDPSEPHGRHWILLLPCRRLFFLPRTDVGASRLGRRDTRLRQPLELLLVSLRSVRQLGIRVLPLQGYPFRRRASVNILAKTLFRLRSYVGLRAAGVRRMPTLEDRILKSESPLFSLLTSSEKGTLRNEVNQI